MKKNIDDLVVDELDRLLKKDPIKLANAMLAVFATGLVEARSAVTKVSNELTIENKRYKVECKIEIKELKNNHETTNPPTALPNNPSTV